MHGKHSLVLDLGLRRSFQWVFIIAKLVLGVNFLQHFGLSVGVRNKQLSDTLIQLKVNSIASGESSLKLTHFLKNMHNRYEAILYD